MDICFVLGCVEKCLSPGYWKVCFVRKVCVGFVRVGGGCIGFRLWLGDWGGGVGFRLWLGDWNGCVGFRLWLGDWGGGVVYSLIFLLLY